MNKSTRIRRYLLASMVIALLVAVPVVGLASHSFVDVDDDNTFHNDIAWLAEADVTRGCNPPANTRFCPKDFVTREQMAAFMNRLANNGVVKALGPVLFHAGDSPDVSFPNTTGPGRFNVIQVQTVTVEAPEASGGVVLVNAGGNILGNGAVVENDRNFACWVSDDPASTSSSLGAHVTFVAGQAIGGNVISRPFSTTTVFEINPGETIDVFLLCRDTAGQAGNLFRVTNGHLSATFMTGSAHIVDPATP